MTFFLGLYGVFPWVVKFAPKKTEPGKHLCKIFWSYCNMNIDILIVIVISFVVDFNVVDVISFLPFCVF